MKQFKKIINYLLLALFVFFLFNDSKLETVKAESYESGSYDSNIEISDYISDIYSATQRPELDKFVYQAFKIYEENKNSPNIVTVYSGTKEECIIFRDYFNLNYGYTKDFYVNVLQYGDNYKVGFLNTLNSKQSIYNYMSELQKAQSIAASLKGNSTDSTIQNVIDWVKCNAKYAYDVTDDNVIEHYYGIYSGKEVVCQGYANAVYQLLAMNGIKAELCDIVHPNGVLHAVNLVYFSDKPRYVDTTLINPVSDVLWEGCTLYTQY